MRIKIIDITLKHNNEYALLGAKEIVAVDSFDTTHERKAHLICQMA